MVKKLALVAALAGAFVGQAYAAPVLQAAWGTHSVVDGEGATFANLTKGAAPFDNVYTFSLGAVYDLLFTAVANNAPPVFNLTNGSVSLYKSNGDGDYTNDGAALASLAFGGSTVFTSLSGVAAGDYYYRVTGDFASAKKGGSYTIQSSITPVPEPETYALLLAGLGVIGFIAKRRQIS